MQEAKTSSENSTNGQSLDSRNKLILNKLLEEIRLLLNELKSESFMSHSQVIAKRISKN